MCYWDKLIITWIRYYNAGVTETLTNIYENIILWIVNEQFQCELNTNCLKITPSNLQTSISCHLLIPYRYGVETYHLSNWIVRLDIYYLFQLELLYLIAPYIIHTYGSHAISMKCVKIKRRQYGNCLQGLTSLMLGWYEWNYFVIKLVHTQWCCLWAECCR